MKGERNQNWLIQCCFYYYFCMTIIIIIVIICDGGGPPLLSPSVRMGKKDHFREVVECMDRRCRGDVSWYEMWIKSQVNLKKMISVFLSLRHSCLKTSQQMILRNGGDDRSVQKYTWHLETTHRAAVTHRPAWWFIRGPTHSQHRVSEGGFYPQKEQLTRTIGP